MSRNRRTRARKETGPPVQSLLRRGVEHQRKERYERAIVDYRNVLRLIPTMGSRSDDLPLEVQWRLGDCMAALGDGAGAIVQYREVLSGGADTSRCSHIPYLVRAHLGLAGLVDHDAVLGHLIGAEDLLRAHGDTEGLGGSILRLRARLLREGGDLEGARMALLAARDDLVRRLGHEPDVHELDRTLEDDLATIADEAGHVEESIGYMLRILDHHKLTSRVDSNDDPWALAVILDRLATLLFRAGRHDDALRRSIEITSLLQSRRIHADPDFQPQLPIVNLARITASLLPTGEHRDSIERIQENREYEVETDECSWRFLQEVSRWLGMIGTPEATRVIDSLDDEEVLDALLKELEERRYRNARETGDIRTQHDVLQGWMCTLLMAMTDLIDDDPFRERAEGLLGEWEVPEEDMLDDDLDMILEDMGQMVIDLGRGRIPDLYRQEMAEVLGDMELGLVDAIIASRPLFARVGEIREGDGVTLIDEMEGTVLPVEDHRFRHFVAVDDTVLIRIVTFQECSITLSAFIHFDEPRASDRYREHLTGTGREDTSLERINWSLQNLYDSGATIRI